MNAIFSRNPLAPNNGGAEVNLPVPPLLGAGGALLLLLCLLVLVPAVPGHAAAPRPPVVAKPNLDIYVYRRSYTPGEKVQIRLSG